MPGREEALQRATEWRTRRGHEGPASDLPSADFPESYGSNVYVRPRHFERGPVTPFGREFVFDGSNAQDVLEQGGDPGRTGTIGERSQRFLDSYFNGESSPVKNPATGGFYGKELKAHDAFHEFANVGNTLRGEELLTIGESVGNTPLIKFGLRGLTQQIGSRFEEPDSAEKVALSMARMGGPVLVQRRGAAQGSSLFRDRNSAGSFLSPPIQPWEAREMVNRGREFYDQVHGSFRDYTNAPEQREILPSMQSRDFIDTRPKVNAIGDVLSGPDSALVGTQIRGGYGGRNQMPFGDVRQFMNAPMVPVVDYIDYRKSLNRKIGDQVKVIGESVNREVAEYRSPRQAELRFAEEDWSSKRIELLNYVNRVNAFGPASSSSAGKGGDVFDEVFKGSQDGPPAGPTGLSQAETERFHRYLGGAPDGWVPPEIVDRAVEDAIGARPKPMKLSTWGQQRVSDDGLDANDIRDSLDDWIDQDVRQEFSGGSRAGVATDFSTGRPLQYLNPPNLGSNAARGGRLRDSSYPGNKWAADALLTAARDAKDAPLVRRAIRTGFNAAADIGGSVPLFDPGFRQAVEKGDVGEAARRVGIEYAAGTAAAPVVGAAAGVMQRLAPATAAQVLPVVAGVSKVGNPVAVVSQLGGDSRMNAAADSQAIARQVNLAQQARERGPRWSVPTPWGPVKIPELGISESGGLFPGNSSARPLGTTARLGGRPVVWAGDAYGWQSEGSARNLGVSRRR